MRLLPVGAALLMVAPRPAAGSAAADGWTMLWQNRGAEARAQFRQSLKQQPNDTRALRGLGLLSDQEDSGGAALQAWRRLYQIAPGHWSAAAYWPRVLELSRQTGRWSLLAGAAQEIVAAPKAAPELRASARQALAAIAEQSGKTAEAAKHRQTLGYVTRWRIIGPFDNVSLSGFDKAYPPEREIDLKKSYTGKDEKSLRWYPLSLVGRDGQCGISAGLGDEGANVFYAVTSLFSPKEQAVRFRWDPTGASKLFLNGRLIFSDDVYRVQRPLIADPFSTPARFQKGWNTVLVKIADDESLRAAFAFRVTSPTGEDAVVTTADPAQVAVGGSESTAVPETTPVEPALVTLLRREAPEGDPEAAVAIARYLHLANDLTAAATVMRATIAKAPDCGWLHWVLSSVLEDDEQSDDARAERELARERNPRLVLAELGYLEDEAAALTPADRLRRLKTLRQSYPASPAVLWALAEELDEAGFTAESLKTARAAAALNAGPTEVNRAAGFYLVQGRKSEAATLINTALKATPFSLPLLQGRASLLWMNGSIPAAIAQYQRLAQLDPTNTSYQSRLAEFYRSSKDLKKSAQILARAREQRPQDAGLCSRLADVLREMGKKPEAIALYRTAIRLAPAQVSLRDKLQLLTGERPVIDLVPATPIAPILAKAPKSVPGASSMILLDEARHVVYPDYANFMRARLVIKVFDTAAVERYQAVPLGVDDTSESATLESARIIKPDGKIQDVSNASDGTMVALPSLAPGDVIDVSYRVDGYPSGGLAGQFWGHWRFTNDEEPVQLSRYVLITPPGMSLQVRSHGGVPEPQVKDHKNWRVREWRMADVPVRKAEQAGPGTTETGSWLDLSTLTSWRQIVDWYRDLSRPRCVPDAAVRAKAAELTRDAKTSDDKLRALVNFVAREIRYQTTPFRNSAYVPTPGKQVLRERYGDCKDKAALLTAMLASVGIKSHMVLLSGRSEGVAPYLPSPRFNHAIALVEMPGGPVWVDATADQLEFGGLPFQDQQVPALVIDDKSSELVLTPALPIERNRLADVHEAVLGADEKLTGSLELEAAGDWGWIMRSILQRVPEASREEALRGLGAALLEDARCETSSMQHLADPDRPLSLRFRYAVDRYSSRAGNFLLVRLPWRYGDLSKFDALAADTARTRDMETSSMRGHFVSSVRLQLPDGFVPQELQPELNAESAWGSYRFTYRLEGNVLHARRELKLTPLRVTAAEFPRFVEFLRAFDSETKRQLVLKQP
jgi:cellulose synthase operon protein C